MGHVSAHARCVRLLVCAAGLLVSWQVPARAQSTSPALRPRPSGAAVAVAEGPTLDGDVLADPAWNAATPLEGFWQEQPVEGAPSTEKTGVRGVCTRDPLYPGGVG